MGLVTLNVSAEREFPVKDISDGNADILSLLLQNGEMIRVFHDSAEGARYLYRVGHMSLIAVALNRLTDPAKRHAFSLGITAYEAMATLVRPDVQDEPARATLELVTAKQALSDDFSGVLTDARDHFLDTTPNAARVVAESTARFQADPAYALAGAGITRQIEIDSTDKVQ